MKEKVNQMDKFRIGGDIMKKKIAIIMILVLCVGVGATAIASEGKIATTEDGKKVLLKPDGTWEYLDESNNKSNSTDKTIIELSANGMKTTEPFTVDSSWKLKWDAEGSIFQAYLYNKNGNLVNVIANQQGAGKGSSYYPKAGEYYLQINAIGNWSLKVVKSE